MLTKLVDISKKNIIIGFFIKIACCMIFATVSSYNEFCGWLRSIGIGGRKYKSLKKYKDKHKGKRCFIIATGPSLTENGFISLNDIVEKGYDI